MYVLFCCFDIVLTDGGHHVAVTRPRSFCFLTVCFPREEKKNGLKQTVRCLFHVFAKSRVWKIEPLRPSRGEANVLCTVCCAFERVCFMLNRLTAIAKHDSKCLTRRPCDRFRTYSGSACQFSPARGLGLAQGHTRNRK